jgi:hypothetical protein
LKWRNHIFRLCHRYKTSNNTPITTYVYCHRCKLWWYTINLSRHIISYWYFCYSGIYRVVWSTIKESFWKPAEGGGVGASEMSVAVKLNKTWNAQCMACTSRLPSMETGVPGIFWPSRKTVERSSCFFFDKSWMLFQKDNFHDNNWYIAPCYAAISSLSLPPSWHHWEIISGSLL